MSRDFRRFLVVFRGRSCSTPFTFPSTPVVCPTLPCGPSPGPAPILRTGPRVFPSVFLGGRSFFGRKTRGGDTVWDTTPESVSNQTRKRGDIRLETSWKRSIHLPRIFSFNVRGPESDIRGQSPYSGADGGLEYTRV